MQADELRGFKDGVDYGNYVCRDCGETKWDVWPWGKPSQCPECGVKALKHTAYQTAREIASRQEQRIINAILGVA